MSERIFSAVKSAPDKGETSLKVIFRSEIHEIHLWRIKPDDWIYPHIHPHNDDIWYILQGTGEYYLTAEKTRTVKPGDIAAAAPGEVHGMYNSGSEEMLVYSVLSPLPVEIDPAPGFEYPE